MGVEDGTVRAKELKGGKALTSKVVESELTIVRAQV